MEKKKSLFQSILLRVHYKASLAMIAIFLGMLAFSGYYFFGQNIVNEAEEQQRIARVQMNESPDDNESDLPQGRVTPEGSTQEAKDTGEKNIGGQEGMSTVFSPTPTTPTLPTASLSATPSATSTQTVPLSAAQFVLGDSNAEISILAYYDFECVYCASFIANTLPLLKEEYIDTGKAKIIFKNFPLSTHKTATVAHNAAMCAADQKKFWQYHNELFTKQSEWSGKNEQDSQLLMKTYAAKLALNQDAFGTCLENNLFANYVESDKTEGKGRGVSGTPTFIIGESTLVGAQPYDAFKTVLDAQ